MRRSAVVALLALWAGGCFSVPDFADGTLRCAERACPPSFQCHTDGFCYRGPEGSARPDAPVSKDAGTECAGTDKRCNDNRPQTCDTSGHWVDAAACPTDQPTCDQGACVAPCIADTIRCNGQTLREVCVDGRWGSLDVCDFVCSAGACGGMCVPQTSRCSEDGTSEERCDNTGTWQTFRTCPLSCDPATRRCGGDCTGDEIRCDGNNRQRCSGTSWMTVGPCTPTCSNGECRPCDPAAPEKQCVAGQVLQTCQAGGTWDTGVPCDFACHDRACVGVCKPNTVICDQKALKSCGLDGTYDSGMTCAVACVVDHCTECTDGAHRCNGLGTGTEMCAGGKWTVEASCPNGCHEPATCNACNPGTFAGACQDTTTRLTCSPATFTVTPVACTAPTPACLGGACVACTPGTQRCNDTNIERCDTSGAWQVIQTCAANGCFDPVPVGGTDQTCGRCPVNAKRCSNGKVQTCVIGDWQDGPTCLQGCFDSDGESGPDGQCGTCMSGDKRCTTNKLEVCMNGQYQLMQSCAASSQTCFDPAPPGGSDAYCGVCVNNAKRCSLGTLQVCVSGAWMDSQGCGAAADCIDPDGDTGPGGACSTCAAGHLQCSGSVLQTCQGGAFMNTTDCGATGKKCIDPLPQGGTDAYCGVCLNGAKRCLGTGLQVCTAGAWASAATCDATLGCNDPDGESGPGGYCRVCTDNHTQCANGNLETCMVGQWVPRAPACSSTAGNTCFDPAPAGGTDAYCGNCLEGADRCNPSTGAIQVCPNGLWTDASPPCSLGCFDPGGDQSASPAAYCGTCAPGDKGCQQNTLLGCSMGQLVASTTCSGSTPTCFDPGTPGGSDAYCGVCLVGSGQCVGDIPQTCKPDGSDWDSGSTCSFGCHGAAVCCAAPPDCPFGEECGESSPNACGVTKSCGSCGPTQQCCPDQHCTSAPICE